MDTRLFAVERYGIPREERARAPRLPRDITARLIGVIQLTDDDVGLAVVEGTDSDSVRAAMTAAGWRVDRVTAAEWIDPASGEAAEDLAAREREGAQ